MKWQDWLEEWNMTSLRISVPFLEMEWSPSDSDKEAAWELYIELLTRITTQPLCDKEGDEETALESIHSFFGTTRSIIKAHGRSCEEFTKIAIVVLNQKIRPFTAKWHKALVDGRFNDSNVRKEFRQDLAGLQAELKKFTKMLAGMSGVEDLTNLEEE